ncbi:hypothetical protein J6590_050770 [Homalodisca vitripennis]|nr:hypothetical protein J6590_050770 [Homalodisca vitripennis]
MEEAKFCRTVLSGRTTHYGLSSEGALWWAKGRLTLDTLSSGRSGTVSSKYSSRTTHQSFSSGEVFWWAKGRLTLETLSSRRRTPVDKCLTLWYSAAAIGNLS